MTNKTSLKLYRYRGNIDPKSDCNIFKELEKQEIYCASSEELNDPMERINNVVWQNDDSIAWKNFLTKYLSHLADMFLVAKTITERRKETFRDIFCEKVLLNQYVKDLLEFSVSTKFDRDRLILWFEGIHILARKILFEVASKYGLYPSNFNHSINDISDAERENIMHILKNANGDEMRQIATYNRIIEYLRMKNVEYSEHFTLLFLIFPSIYVDRLIKDLYPNNYVACFSSENNNASMWGHYAKEHKGICLQFDTYTNEQEFFLDQNSKHKFYSVKYDISFPTIDFWKSVTTSKEQCIEEFIKYCSFKHEDWRYEAEYRLMRYYEKSFGHSFDSVFIPLSKKERIIKYDFSSLTGIIFGMRTTLKDKCEIIKIIKQKCEQAHRENFIFYQAGFDHASGKIKPVPFSKSSLEDCESKLLNK